MPTYVSVDPIFGRSLIPGSMIVTSLENFNIAEVNNEGYFGKAYLENKNDDIYRIALLGDSFVEGLQVKDEHHIRNIIEENLNNNFKSNFQVINFGRSGMDISSMYILNKLKIEKYEPDITFIFLQDQDFEINNKKIEPKLIINDNNTLNIDYSFNQNNDYLFYNSISFLRNLSFYTFLKSFYSNFKNNNIKEVVFDKFNYFKPVYNNNQKIITHDIHLKILEDFKEIEKNNDTKFVIVSIKELSSNITDILINNNFEIINLKSVYDSMEKNMINPFYWKASNIEGHWNRKAHKYIGNFLVKEFISTVDLDTIY